MSESIFVRITKRRKLEITIGRTPNKAVFRRSMGDANQTLRDALEWLSGRVPDPVALLAERAPALIEAATAESLDGDRRVSAAPRGGQGWALYGRIAVVRPAEGGFTVTLGIHGGARNVPGLYATHMAATMAARKAGAEIVVCCAQGENGGNSLPRDCRTRGIDYHETERFGALVRARSGQPERGPNAPNQLLYVGLYWH